MISLNQMQKKTKKQILSWLLVMILIGGSFWFYQYATKIELPIVGESGEISGSYSMDSILSLNKPYKCTLLKKDEASKINGTFYTDGKQIAADFRIQAENLENKIFNSFLIIKNKEAYIWTDLSQLGLKISAVKSASQNASPAEQAQLIGTRDKVALECSLLENIDISVFEIPGSITFTSL